MSGNYHMVVLDEINVAMSLGFLDKNDVLDMIDKKPEHIELILTGRDVPEEIIEKADLVTEMKLKKHYFDKGVMARRGIEY